MSEGYDTDVVIAGYGPTGVIAALTLARLGISVTALERHRDIYPRARAVTVNDWTMRIFQNLGVDEAVTKQIDPQRALRWMRYDGTELLRIEHPPSTLGVRPRFYNIYQPTMEATLRECAARQGGDRLQVRYGTELAGLEQNEQGVTVSTRDLATGEVTRIRARYALGCDGGSSTMRGLLDIPLDGDTLDVLWIVIDCRVKRWWPDRNLLTFWSDKERPVVDIALSGGNHRWELPLKPHESEADFDTHEKIWPLLKAMGVSEHDVEIHQHAFYRHHTRMARRWREGRAFLAGDAAHLMPPWAGAGMQTGMRDAYDIGWKLAGVLKGELPEQMLDSYEAERRPNAAFYTQLAVQLGRIIKQELSEEEQAALNAPPPDPANPPEPPLIAPPVLAGGWLRGQLSETSIVGRMVPQPTVGDTRGAMARLDELLGHRFVLLGDDVDPAALLSAEEKAGWDALNARYIAVRPQDRHTQGPDELVDLDGVIAAWLRKYRTRVAALRPDRFVAAADAYGLAVPAEPTT